MSQVIKYYKTLHFVSLFFCLKIKWQLLLPQTKSSDHLTKHKHTIKFSYKFSSKIYAKYSYNFTYKIKHLYFENIVCRMASTHFLTRVIITYGMKKEFADQQHQTFILNFTPQHKKLCFGKWSKRWVTKTSSL